MRISLYTLLSATVFFVTFSSASAQIAPDAFLGKESSAIGPTQPGTGAKVITGGAARGSSLFHSFKEFSIRAGEKVYFGNPSGVNDILTRVTGDSASNILGTLGVLGDANLFLLNPNGIIFAGDANLDLNGSFLGTTANSFTFTDGSTFSAINPQTAPLLTVNLPIGLNFSGGSKAIQVLNTPQIQSQLPFVGTFPTPVIIDGRQTGLRVDSGKTFALVGGPVSFDSGIAAAPMGRIEVGAVDQGVVVIGPDPKGLTLDYDKATNFDDIQLTKFSLLDVSGLSGNQLQLQGRQVSLSNGSFLAVGNTGSQADSTIEVNASETLKVTGFKPDPEFSAQFPGQKTNSVVWSYTLAGKGADILISTPKLDLETAGIVLSSALASGTAGKIEINAGESVRAAGFIPEIIRPGGLPSKFSGIASIAYGSGSRTGDISVKTKNLLLQDLGAVGTFGFESASASNLLINATDLVELRGSDPASGFATRLVSVTAGEGNAGDLRIDTKQLQVLDGGTVGSTTISNGDAGDVEINASTLTRVSGEVPGTINRSRIVSAAQLQEPRLRQLLGLPPILGTGNAQNLTINTGQLLVENNGEVSVQNDGFGEAGNLTINAASVRLSNKGSISGSVGSGDGGIITLSVNDLLLLQNRSELLASASGIANGGSINVNTSLLVLDDSKISGSADQGQGGDVTINTQGIFQSPDSTITATSERGAQFDGIVQINSLDLNLTKVEPSISKLQSPEVASVCQSRTGNAPSEFINAGNGGVPPAPEDALTTNSGWQDRSFSEAQPSLPQLEATVGVKPTKFIDAQGWKSNPNGTISFVANAEEADPDALFVPSICYQTENQNRDISKKQHSGNSLPHTP